MKTMTVDIQSSFVQALRTQAKSELVPCPYPGHYGRVLETLDHLYSHVKVTHTADFAGLRPSEIREPLRESIKRTKYGISLFMFTLVTNGLST
jgi:hypothetical protein